MTQITKGSQVQTIPRSGTVIASNTVLNRLIKQPNGHWLRDETTTFETHLVEFADGSKEWFRAKELEATDVRSQSVDVRDELGSKVVPGGDAGRCDGGHDGAVDHGMVHPEATEAGGKDV